jgi:hypothetical protein
LNFLLEKTFRRFLLGIARDEEQSRIEDSVLGGDLDASSLLDVEDGLIDDYLLGSLTQEERNGFTTHFLSTNERRQRLAFAAALIEYAQKQPGEELPVRPKLAARGPIRILHSWKQGALLAAAASVVLAALAGFQQVQLRRQGQIASEAQNELIRLRTALDSGNGGATRPGVQSPGPFGNPQIKPEEIPRIEFAFSTRSVFPDLFRIPAHAQFVRIDIKQSLPLAMKYREVLIASNGDQLWAQEFPASILPPTNQSTIVLPASILLPGSYHLRLERASADNRFEESGDWVFRVVKE